MALPYATIDQVKRLIKEEGGGSTPTPTPTPTEWELSVRDMLYRNENNHLALKSYQIDIEGYAEEGETAPSINIDTDNHSIRFERGDRGHNWVIGYKDWTSGTYDISDICASSFVGYRGDFDYIGNVAVSSLEDVFSGITYLHNVCFTDEQDRTFTITLTSSSEREFDFWQYYVTGYSLIGSTGIFWDGTNKHVATVYRFDDYEGGGYVFYLFWEGMDPNEEWFGVQNITDSVVAVQPKEPEGD